MILSWAFIGITAGLLLGITGAGGAIVAVPLFIFLADTSIRDATVLSLIAVMSGALLNWLVQARNTDFRLGLLLFAFSTVGSLLLKPVKAQSPEWVVTALFIGVAVVSLVSIWKKSRAKSCDPNEANSTLKSLLLRSALGGVSLGGLVTMTGLGGGGVIVPFLKGVCDLPLARAAATSLLTVFLSSVFSIWLQREFVATDLDATLVLALVGGSVFSALITKVIIKRIPQTKLDHFRKILVTIVILLSAGSLLFAVAPKGEITMGRKSEIHMTDLNQKYPHLTSGEIILDVRTPEEFAEAHVPGARNINHEDVEKYAQELSKYETVYVHCRSGKRAQMAVDALTQKGLKNLVLVKDSGMMDWTELGYPVEAGKR